MKKPILVVTSHFIKPVDARIESNYEFRRKTDGTLFTPNELLAAAEGADAMLITPFDRLDAEFFRQVSSSVKVISTYPLGLIISICARLRSVTSQLDTRQRK